MNDGSQRNQFLRDYELADRWRVSVKTLANWRVSGLKSLSYVKIGRSVRYRLSDVEAFETAFLRKNTGQEGGSNGS